MCCPFLSGTTVIMGFVFFLFQSSREQLAIAEYARSLLTIPKQLAVNAAKDSTDLVAKLRAYHNTSQMKLEHKELKWYVFMLVTSSKSC